MRILWDPDLQDTAFLRTKMPHLWAWGPGRGVAWRCGRPRLFPSAVGRTPATCAADQQTARSPPDTTHLQTAGLPHRTVLADMAAGSNKNGELPPLTVLADMVAGSNRTGNRKRMLRPLPQSRQSAKRFSSRWNWDSPTPLAAGECAPPPFDPGGRAISLAAKGVGESQFQRGDIHCGALCI
jgi:hypothetical protein